MTGEQFRAACTKVGLSRADVMDMFGVTSQTIDEWEQGSRPIPARVKRELVMVGGIQDTATEVDRLAAQRGIGVCDWGKLRAATGKPLQRGELGQHMATCPICIARGAIVNELRARNPPTLWQRIRSLWHD
jgi:hypothetical protein